MGKELTEYFKKILNITKPLSFSHILQYNEEENKWRSIKMKTIFKKAIPVLFFILIFTQSAFGFTNGEWLKIDGFEQRQNFKVDRSEICKYAVLLYEQLSKTSVKDAKSNFKDAPAEEFPFVAKAHSIGIVSGVDGTNFAPGRVVTKAELAEILYQTVYKAYPNVSLASPDSLVFQEAVSPGMEEACKFAVSRGLLSYEWNGKVGFQNELTLKETSEILDRTRKAAPFFNITVTTLPVVKSDKVAYLTFDDGVSKNTPLILDILQKNNAKATFFVTGESNPELLLRMKKEGHSIGNHTYSHDYSSIYSSTEQFWKDFDKEEDYLESVLGYRPNLMRFPGGSNNTVSQKYNNGNIMNILTSQAKEKGYLYFDWNVSSGDASSVKASKTEIYNNVITGAKGKKEIVVLMHQTAPKDTTVAALDDMIVQLQSEGYTMEALTDTSFCPQFLK